jgi:hypothetical protein
MWNLVNVKMFLILCLLSIVFNKLSINQNPVLLGSAISVPYKRPCITLAHKEKFLNLAFLFLFFKDFLFLHQSYTIPIPLSDL